ncbi:MAG: lipoyl synthase [Thermodesulfobacteriota bacterium]|nr:lipoyl synthase [Thermodesulfobacteriota bacterium]
MPSSTKLFTSREDFKMNTIEQLYDETTMSHVFDRAWALSRFFCGNILSAHVPGMFVVNGRRGRYRAVSITEDRCELGCEHCKGKLLKTMLHAGDAAALKKIGLEASARGDSGILISGGCDLGGKLPWDDFCGAIAYLKKHTSLKISVHTGIIDYSTALILKHAGVDQALVDVIGDELTAALVYHLPNGVDLIKRSMENLARADLETVPHILFGLHYGAERGETHALNIIGSFPIRKYVVVVLMPMPGTPMSEATPPSPVQVAMFLANARIKYPSLQSSLGCARPRGHYRRNLDVLAVRAGVNSIALPSDRALEFARDKGLEIVSRESCCSLG